MLIIIMVRADNVMAPVTRNAQLFYNAFQLADSLITWLMDVIHTSINDFIEFVLYDELSGFIFALRQDALFKIIEKWFRIWTISL